MRKCLHSYLRSFGQDAGTYDPEDLDFDEEEPEIGPDVVDEADLEQRNTDQQGDADNERVTKEAGINIVKPTSDTDKRILDGKRSTTPYMTKYERARVLGTRALQIRLAALSAPDESQQLIPLQHERTSFGRS